MTAHITALYACLLTIGAIVLTNMVSARRGKLNISILYGDDDMLPVLVRRHGNFVENVPLALLLLLLSELGGMAGVYLHAMGIVLIVSRLLHAIGLSATQTSAPLRIAGGVGTQLVMLSAVIFLLFQQFLIFSN